MNGNSRPEAAVETPAKKSTTSIAPHRANRETLRRRLLTIATAADRKGDRETAALARWLAAGAR